MPAPEIPYLAGDEFLLRLYGCCTDPKRWPEVLDLLCAEIGSYSAVLQDLNMQGARGASTWMVYDSHIDMESYRASISDAGNPRLDSKRCLSASGRLVGDEELFCADERPLQSRIQQQLSTIGLGRFLGGLIPLGPGRYMALALHRDLRDQRDFSARERDRLYSLLPHFAQAMSLGQAITSSRSAEAMLHSHLERWPCGLIVCNSVGQVQWLNHAARTQMSAGCGLQLRDGILRALRAEAHQQLARALLRQVSHTIPSFLVLEIGGCRWQLALERLDSFYADNPDMLLVVLTSDQPTGSIPAAGLMTLFGLTEAEARLTSALVSGLTLEQYAQYRGVALGTVRYQLKQVLAKTGAGRQADLVRRVLCSAAAFVIRSADDTSLPTPAFMPHLSDP